MSLADVPAILILVGMTAYAVLAFADFGAGFWHLTASGDRSRAIREHAHHAMGPVWEANHVWLIFILVVAWTAYPTAFGSVASTLAVPLFLAAVGIIVRGTTYALKSQSATRGEDALIGGAFAASSLLTPFFLGTVVGGMAAGRVPVGNAAGDLLTSWLNWTAVFVGVMAVGAGIYLAAVYLAADAMRLREPEMVEAFRRRGLVAGVVVGVLGAVSLVVVRQDSPGLWHGLTHGWALAAIAFSGLCGAATLLLLAGRRFEPARLAGAGAVAGVLAGWAFAQRPDVLPGLNVHAAAASRTVLIAVIIAALIGFVVLAPSLALLFGLLLRGRLDTAEQEEGKQSAAEPLPTPPVPALLLAAGGCLIVGLVLALPEGDWVRVVSVAGLLGFAALAFLALAGASE